jgi:predicted transcriptional regulator
MNGTAFRKSLEDKILTLYGKTGIPISRYRKIIAFNRLLARLIVVDPDGWVLKGGYMMELQFHQKARTTKDIDLLFIKPDAEIQKILRQASKISIADWFSFEIGSPVMENQGGEKTVRYSVKAFLDSRTFESFHIDINNHDQILAKPKFVDSGDILRLSEFPPFKIPCYSFEQQIAEKFHALTRSYKSGAVSRVKDLVDILLIANTNKISFTRLRKYLISTFENRKTHQIPMNAPEISPDYEMNFAKLSREIGLKQKNLKQANDARKELISPILANQKVRIWDPDLFRWG